MARTIRICSLVALALALMPVGAMAKRIEPSALSAYMRGRVADRANDNTTAVQSYTTALSLASDDALVAFRAYRAGVDAGDYALALRAARTLERSGILPPDARVVLYIGAVRDRDWSAARALLTQIGREDGFSFLAPLFAGWLAMATGEKPASEDKRVSAYAAENAALLTIARGDAVAGKQAVEAVVGSDAYRTSTLRLTAAASLAARRQKDLATALLAGDDAVFVAARALIARNKPLPGAVDTPARGASFVLQRMAVDLLSERSVRSSITLARFAMFADPDSPQARIVAASVLGFAKRNAEALALIDPIARDPIYGDVAVSTRIDLLEASGRTDAAYALALTRQRTAGDLIRLGDLEARRGNFVNAIGHYRRAVEKTGAERTSAQLWLALGNALDQGGDWPSARAALERALALSPDDPRLLNQLGYGMADRGQDLDRAFALLSKASRAQPESAAIADSVGWAHFRAGRIEKAITILERARELDPAEPDIAEHLGDAYWAAGRRIEARYTWAAAREATDGAALDRLTGKIEQRRP